MRESVLGEIDKQLVDWIEQLDTLYSDLRKISKMVDKLEEQLSTLKKARRALALEWGDTSEEVSIPLEYTSEGVTDAIYELLSGFDKALSVDEIVALLKSMKYNFGSKNPRRVVNMALVNDGFIESDSKGKYRLELPF